MKADRLHIHPRLLESEVYLSAGVPFERGLLPRGLRIAAHQGKASS